MSGSNSNKRNICPNLDKRGLWRLTGEIDQPEVPWPLNELQQNTLSDFKRAQKDGTIKFVQRINCACGVEEPIHLANIDRFGLPINSYICGNCGLIYTSPVLTPDSLRPFYEKYYHLLHFGSPPSSDKTLYAKGQGKKIYNLLKKWCDTKKITVLEVGCGSGSVIKEFIKEALNDGCKARGIGLEYSKEYVECFDPEGLDIKLLSGDLHNIASSTGPYDVVIMSHVFEHFLEPQVELQTLKKFINEHSLIYIEVPGIFSLSYRYVYNCDYLRYFTFAHIYNFNLISLTNLLSKNGFGLLWGNEEIESVYSLGRQTIDTSDNTKNVITYIRNLELNLLFFTNLSSKIIDAGSEIRLLTSDMNYVKSLIDSILTFYPIRLSIKIRNFFKVNKQ